MNEVASSTLKVLDAGPSDATRMMTPLGSAGFLESDSKSSEVGPRFVLESHSQATSRYWVSFEATPCIGGVLLPLPSPIVVDQAYFWTPRWQRGEREAQADIDAGRVKRFKTAKDLIAELND